MGGYLSTYLPGSSEQPTNKTIVIEPSKPKEISEVDDKKDNIAKEAVVADLTSQIIEEHVKKTDEVVTQIIEPVEAKQPDEAKQPVATVESVEAKQPVESSVESQKSQESQEPKQESKSEETTVEKKIEIDPVEVNKSADVVKKNKKKKNKH